MIRQVKPVFIPVWIAERVISGIVAIFLFLLGRRFISRRNVSKRIRQRPTSMLVVSLGRWGTGKRRFIFRTTYRDYESHGAFRVDCPVRVKVYACGVKQAAAVANRWIRSQNSKYSGYDLIQW